jgi:hypothetical protein
MNSIQKLTSMNELFNHTDIKKLIVFRYLSENGNSKNNITHLFRKFGLY